MNFDTVNAKLKAVFAGFEVWFPVGNHRWVVAVTAALVLGFVVRGCVG